MWILHQRRRIVLVILAVLAAGGLGVRWVATMPRVDARPQIESLVIVSPHSAPIRHEIGRAFTASMKARGREVQLRWIAPGGTGDALRYVQSHCKTDEDCEASVFFGGGPEAFETLENGEFLQELPSDYGVPPELNGVPLRSFQNRWTAAALSSFGILWNRQLAEKHQLAAPDSWADLARPSWRGHIELADPRHSGSAHAIYENILQLYGWERGWRVLVSLAANARPFQISSSAGPRAVARGKAIATPTIHFLARAAIDESPNALSYLEPPGEQILTPDPIAILRSAPHTQLAREFVAWVLSPTGQKLWMLRQNAPGGPREANLYRLAVLPSLYHPQPAGSLAKRDPYDLRNVRPYDAAKAVRRAALLDDAIGVFLVERQEKLRHIHDFSDFPPPFSEARADQLAPLWSNPKIRAARLASWRGQEGK